MTLPGEFINMAGFIVGMPSLTKELLDVFQESSEDDVTFYGFSDTELKDMISNSDYEDQLDHSSSKKKTSSRKSPSPQPFRLRVALRSAPPPFESTDDEAEEDEKRSADTTWKKSRETHKKWIEKHVKVEEEEILVNKPLNEDPLDSPEDVSDTFLVKRAENIKANKAMLSQLMADLKEMSGGACFLTNQKGEKKMKSRISRPPRSAGTERESRRNPERVTRRTTRSMAESEDAFTLQETDVKLTLEEELLEVRHTPLRRGSVRPNQSKPHPIRPVEEITEDELQLVADNMTEKIYNSSTGSTCHQCRQKTIDTKTCCRSQDCRGIQGQFCGPCLRNRYGEDVRKALLDPEWKCPPCRGICNCSFCRQRQGRCPTGILFPLAQYHGFSDVHSYLSSLRNKLKSEGDAEM